MSDNSSDDSFGGNLASSSIYFEDPDAAEQLSLIINSNFQNNGLKDGIKELNEKNELKSAYKNKENIPNEQMKKDFDESKIKATDLQYQSNLDEQNYSKLKSNDISPEDELYLKQQDFENNSISDDFYYSEAVAKIEFLIPSYEKDLKSMDINKLPRENIYLGKGVETMVEQTYGYDKYLKEQMTEEICYLKRVMNCWRRVAGDGNCFYRSAIFSWLEYLVFNKKINVLKIIMSHIYIKFDPIYPKTKELPSDIKKQFITEERFVALTILEIIIRKLKQDNIEEAYLTLIKAFNITRVFDRIMIFYLRYSLYEFISDNEDKLFKKDFPVLLGNLLPQEYETPSGKFLYKEYFIKDLLKFYTCAEKLAVYLVPFILKINLNIVFYYFGNECDIETKFFSCDLPGKDKIKDTINVLFRKAHYDVCYNKEYYNNFQPLLDKYCKLQSIYGNDYYVVEFDRITQKEKYLNEINPYNPQESVVFNKLLYEKNKKNKEKEKEEEKKNNNELSSSEDNIIKNGILEGVSSDKCFICKAKVENIGETLPCGCRIFLCSEICKQKYQNSLSLFYSKMEFGINLKCGTCGKNVNRSCILQNMNFGNENVKNALKNKMLEFYNNFCMNCLKQVNHDSTKSKIVKCKCPQLHKLLDTNKFEHRVCKDCYKNYTGNCKICNIYHSRLVN